RALQVIGPWLTQPGALLREQAAHFVDPFEVAVAEAVQPVADLRFQLEVVQLPALIAYAGHGTDDGRQPPPCREETQRPSLEACRGSWLHQRRSALLLARRETACKSQRPVPALGGSAEF